MSLPPNSTDISLRDYLRQLARNGRNAIQIPQYDDFMGKVAKFFRLRVEAEQLFEKKRHTAISKHGALPVSWFLVEKIWNSLEPPEQLITVIAKRNYTDICALLGNLRKILKHIHQKIALGRVQQLDAHCLRWLIRQPGNTAAEKGGNRQEILGVTRIESYNTLENRVLKDFLFRCVGLATIYLRNNDSPQFHEHINVRAVRRLRNLCLSGLHIPEFGNVQELQEHPQPNYVLQQDRFYSRIWRAYLDILRQAEVAEKLWDKRELVSLLHQECDKWKTLNCSPRARYHTPLWIYELDGGNTILESPIWRNEEVNEQFLAPRDNSQYFAGETLIIDFLQPWDERIELFYPKNHPNARPFLQDKNHPSLEPGECYLLHDIINNRDKDKLTEYFRQLWGLTESKRWIILVPDHWDAMWLECVIQSRPTSLSRSDVFLLWRSIAAVLGFSNQEYFAKQKNCVIADGYDATKYNLIKLRFQVEQATKRVIPQRSSTQLHSQYNAQSRDIRFYLNQSASFPPQNNFWGWGDSDSTSLIAVGHIPQGKFSSCGPQLQYYCGETLLLEGVRHFLEERRQGVTSYFDELDALSLVIQTRAEEVEFKTLVEHNECWPGGQTYFGQRIKGGALLQGSSSLALNLLEGPQEDDAELKTLQVSLDQKTVKTQDIFFQAEMIPGQGMATLVLTADFLKKSLRLDLSQMKSSGLTKAIIEAKMKRHFPPVMPQVEACESLWPAYSARIYLERSAEMDPGSFAKARPSRDVESYNPKKHSPIDLLRRENVFGNAPGKEYPVSDFPWHKLFKRLAEDYRNGRKVLRLIAWTYQGRAAEFEFIRQDCYEKYVTSVP